MTSSQLLRPRLGVNVDHVATLRQARNTQYPDPVFAASMAELAGADQITIHLREDRRHIQDRDVMLIRQTAQTRLNLEMAMTREMLAIAQKTQPDMVTLVPEKREEQTTEGGLDVVAQMVALKSYITDLRQCGAYISLFIDPDVDQITASHELGVDIVELHTGDYCHAAAEFTNHLSHTKYNRDHELERLKVAARYAASLGLVVAAGHGLDYKNVHDVAAITEFEEFNIGHSIVARSIFVGFQQAVTEMIDALNLGRSSAV